MSNGICEADIDVDAIIAPINQPTVLNAVGPACNGSGDDGSIELAISSSNTDFILDWSDGFSSSDLMRTDLVPDTYSVTITNATGCQTMIDNIELGFELTDPFPPVITQTNASCRGAADGIVEFIDDGMTEFVWNDGFTGARREDLTGGDDFVVTRTVAGNTQCTQDFVITSFGFGTGVTVDPDDIVPCLLYTSPSPRDRG